jgi:hypothetical protein
MDTTRVHRDPAQDTHPHACTNGVVFIGYTAYDEEVGCEVEKLEAIPCRRCAERQAER